jgi:hypothetical protein
MVDVADTLTRVREDLRRISIADINRAYGDPQENLELIQRIVRQEVLPSGLHAEFSEILAALAQ